MKILYLLVLVNLCQGLPLENRIFRFPAPTMIKVAVLDPPAFVVSWNMVDSGNEDDPVVGYKVKVWEVKNININVSTKYVYVDGEVQQMEEELQKQPVDLISGPDEILTSAEETTATYHNVKLDVVYEVRVQAYTENNEGSMSDAIRIQVEKY